MRDTPDLPDRFYEIYAVDADKHWQGAVSLDTLLRARRPVPLSELIEEDRRRVSVLDDQEEVARMFGKYNLVAAPWSTPPTGWSASSPSTTSSTSSRKRPTRI
jgi:magnesium transporter